MVKNGLYFGCFFGKSEKIHFSAQVITLPENHNRDEEMLIDPSLFTSESTDTKSLNKSDRAIPGSQGVDPDMQILSNRLCQQEISWLQPFQAFYLIFFKDLLNIISDLLGYA